MLFYSIRSRKISQKWDRALKLLNRTSLVCLLCPLHPPLFAPSQPSGSPNRPAAPPKPLTKKQTKLSLCNASMSCAQEEKKMSSQKKAFMFYIVCVKTFVGETTHFLLLCAIKAVEVVKTQRRRKISFRKAFTNPVMSQW